MTIGQQRRQQQQLHLSHYVAVALAMACMSLYRSLLLHHRRRPSDCWSHAAAPPLSDEKPGSTATTTTTPLIQITAAAGHNRTMMTPFQHALAEVVNGTPSLQLLLGSVFGNYMGEEDAPPAWPAIVDDDDIVDWTKEAARCRRYNWTLEPNRTVRRRIFAGGMLADDSFHTLGMHALEAYNVYTHYALVESNRTHLHVPRTMRFLPNTSNWRVLTNHGLFGPHTTVTVDYYNVNRFGNISHAKWRRNGLFAQQLQRNVALERWKAAGMQPDDIGILLDVDEVFTRDFLRALQVCDLPELRSGGQTCRRPKIHAKGLFYDGSLLCARSLQVRPGGQDSCTFTPHAILGECLEGIGNATLHPLAPRVYTDKKTGQGVGFRQEGYGGGRDDWSRLPDENQTHHHMYPLWNAADYRRVAGGRQVAGTSIPHHITGFHLNNFYTSATALRWKYATYGDAQRAHDYARTGQALTGRLAHAGLHQLNVLLECAKSRRPHQSSHYNQTQNTGRQRPQYRSSKLLRVSELERGGIPTPQAFRFKAYVEARHDELVRLIQKDEREQWHLQQALQQRLT